MIYTIGSIAVSGNTLTGTGTNFKAPLSMIRVGCTLISVGNPVQIFTITGIKSSTELSVTPAADPAIPAGTKFSILLSDSISVDGLAQDVAETLRYYQGRETEISEAIDFFKNFNLQELKYLVKQSEDSANAAKTSEENAAQSEQNALDIKNQTEQLKNETYQIKNDTQSIKDSAVTEIDAAKNSSIQQIGDTKNSALQEMNAVKQETFDARDEAELARDNANTHANDAKSAKDAAEAARDNAEQLAQQINPENLLQKNKNLSDIADRAAAWLNVRPIGSTPLSGDPVNDYDATTKRWVLSIINTGIVGPTMNGVMNYGVGDFHLRDSRAYIQPYEVVSDGQLLNRADWPELWAYAQMISPVEDADWLADPANRGKYSTGDGETTFRVPDRNGVQEGSIPGLFARGDGGNSSFDGRVRHNAAPNITGSTNTSIITGWGAEGSLRGYGAFVPKLTTSAIGKFATAGTLTTYFPSLDIDASLSNSAYGRDGAEEIRPNAFEGVWVIRASGGFVAANTSWSVINGDTSMPAEGTIIDGGNVCSLYKVNNATEAEANFRARADIGGNYYARISVTNSTTQRSAAMDLDEMGTLSAPSIVSLSGIVAAGKLASENIGYPGIDLRSNRYNTPATQIGALTRLEATGVDGTVSVVNLVRRCGDGSSTGQVIIAFPTTGGTLALQGTSGLEYKKDITDADAQEAMDRINGQHLVNFVYKDDEQERVRFGIIAEEAELIAPQYIKHNQEPYEDILDEDGNKIGEKTRDRPSVDVNPIVMDLMGCVQALTKRIEDMEAEIAELKAGK